MITLTRLLSKLEQYLFYFLLFAIPFQARKILWYQNWNFNEWQSVSIYATDLILLVLFVFWAKSTLRGRQIFNFKFSIFNKFSKLQFYKPDFWLIIFIIISAISIKNAISPQLAVYAWVKLLEFTLFYFYIKNYAVAKFGFVNSLLVIIGGGLFQAVIAILQFFKQSSLGLRLLGESVLSPDLTGIASFYNMAGEKIVRAYGATPHPNILAAYLFLAIFAFYYLWIYKNISKFYLFAYGLTLLAFFFTFARVAVFLFFFGFFAMGFPILINFAKVSKARFLTKEFLMGKILPIVLVTVLVTVAFTFFYQSEAISRVKISSGEEAVQMRIFYNKESLKSLNWFGVGSGNFVNWLMTKDPNLPRGLYQPVHNIYLLIYSETGIFGITAFILFLVFLIKDFIVRTKMNKLYHYSFLLIFLSFLFLGLFDHFLWTLQQGRFMFWLVVALLTFKLKDDIMVKQS